MKLRKNRTLTDTRWRLRRFIEAWPVFATRGSVEKIASLRAFVPAGPAQHVHLICSLCGYQGATDGAMIEANLRDACRDHQFEISQLHIEVSGDCGDCPTYPEDAVTARTK